MNPGYADAAKQMLEEQKRNWLQCGSGYDALTNAEYKEFYFDRVKIKVQFNPRRIVSSAASVDEASIQNRECFLCLENLPAEQKMLKYEDDYLILANPYPIFPEHFTVPSVTHIPQRIKGAFSRMLSLSRDLSEYYTVFYNGPKCGASAPDHLHFQAVTKNFMPVENEIDELKESSGKILVKTGDVTIMAIDDNRRRFFVIESPDENKVNKAFNMILNLLHQEMPGDEPMMNIITIYGDTGWRVLVFPRLKHRPSFYFKEGSEKVLISPAATEMGGLFILPREEDFSKINKDLIEEVYTEVILSRHQFFKICSELA
jgi:hypothetical protein